MRRASDVPRKTGVAGNARDFRALVGAQFFGAFNDNFFNQVLLLLAVGVLFPGEDKQGLAFAIFALPFVLFSGMAGDLSERFSKRTIIWSMKVTEIGIMGLGAAALWWQSWLGLLMVLFLMGTQSAFFGPSKYGSIPEMVRPQSLLKANGIIAMTTFTAILLGTALAGPLLDWLEESMWMMGAFCLVFALVGTGSAFFMGPLPAQKPTMRIRRNPLGRLFVTVGILRREKGLFSIVILNSFFWFNGGVIQQSINALGGAE